MEDFVLETWHLVHIFRCDKASATNRLTVLRKKLGKPNRGIILASEFCQYKGITMLQLSNIISKEGRSSLIADLLK